MRSAEIWAQLAEVRFLGSFGAWLPSTIGLDRVEFETAVEEAATKHFGDLATVREFDVPSYGPGVRSRVDFEYMQVDWEYVDALADYIVPVEDDDIPAMLEFTVAVSYRHELDDEELAMEDEELDRRLLELSGTLFGKLVADLPAACGFRPGNKGWEGDCGYDPAG